MMLNSAAEVVQITLAGHKVPNHQERHVAPDGSHVGRGPLLEPLDLASGELGCQAKSRRLLARLGVERLRGLTAGGHWSSLVVWRLGQSIGHRRPWRAAVSPQKGGPWGVLDRYQASGRDRRFDPAG
jgi:hypothetical protein